MKLKIFLFLVILLIFSIIGCFPIQKKKPNTLYKNKLYNSFIPTSSDKRLMQSIRVALTNNTPIHITDSSKFSFQFNPEYSWISITLYQPQYKSLRYISKRNTLEGTINRVIYKLRKRRRFPKFDISNSSKVRIQFEVITTPFKKVDVSELSRETLGKNRFEIGVDGLKIKTQDKIGFFMPTDGYTRNKLYIDDVIQWLEGRYEVDIENCKVFKFQSRSMVTYKDDVLGLYRGYPIKEKYTSKDLLKSIRGGLNWLTSHQKNNGRFIYFVDSITGGTKDYLYDRSELLDMLGMERYYNILRHSGALLSLLRGYEMFERKEYLTTVNRGLKYLVNTARTRKIKSSKKAAYIYFNRKSKLGGTGLALIAFSRYQQITEDDKYYKLSQQFARHLLAEIKKDGEFNYYYIHPLRGEKPESYFFSFYYPGEALLGLAEFYKICDNKNLKNKIIKKCRKALHFLLDIRPQEYSEHYKSLPSDSWLMTAILELTKIPELDKKKYKDFVYHDALKMIKHQYTPKNALYPDYIGGFYYNYGDHVYPDGARSEGLFSAYELAKREEKETLASLLLKRLTWAALCQLHLVNTPKSIYPVRNPKITLNPNIALGGIRFKLTRQWFRIDTIQHVVSFYMRLINSLKKSVSLNKFRKSMAKSGK